VRLTIREFENGIVVLELFGNIRMGPECQRISQEVDQLVGRGQNRVIFDFSGVDYLDSAGIGTLVSCLTKIKNSGGEMRLAGLKAMVAGVFKLTKIDTIIKLFPTVDEASQNFSPPAQS
jgi:anti-sigma B factor antagonist